MLALQGFWFRLFTTDLELLYTKVSDDGIISISSGISHRVASSGRGGPPIVAHLCLATFFRPRRCVRAVKSSWSRNCRRWKLGRYTSRLLLCDWGSRERSRRLLRFVDA